MKTVRKYLKLWGLKHLSLWRAYLAFPNSTPQLMEQMSSEGERKKKHFSFYNYDGESSRAVIFMDVSALFLRLFGNKAGICESLP